MAILRDLIARVEQLAELLGPNVYVQAAIIAVVFIVFGKVADWVISGVIGRFASKSDNEFDDRLVKLVHRPVFLSFVFIGLGLATRRIGMPETPTFVTVNVLKTMAIVVWYGALGQLNNLIVNALSKSPTSELAESGMLALLHNVLKVVLVALAVYFIFIAWKIDVTAWHPPVSSAWPSALPPRTRCPTCSPESRSSWTPPTRRATTSSLTRANAAS